MKTRRTGGETARERHVDLITLAEVTKVGATLNRRLGRFAAGAAFESGETFFEIASAENAGGVVAYGVGHQHPQRGECAGILGHDDSANAQFAREFAGVQPAAATECGKSKIARVIAAFDRNRS